MATLEKETRDAINAVKLGTVAHQSIVFGHGRREPLLYAMDGMLRYAKAYEKRYNCKLSEDSVLGAHYLNTINGLRGLLDGDGAAAMETGRSQDSKDNGVIEAVFWHCIEAAGFEESDT